MIFVIEKFKIPKYPVILLLIFFLLTGGLSPNSTVWSTTQNPMVNSIRYQYLEKFLKKIPPNAAVSAQSPIVPHVANREKIYLYPEIYDSEYIILDYSLSSYPIDPGNLQNNIYSLRRSKFWKIFAENQTLIIFKRNY